MKKLFFLCIFLAGSLLAQTMAIQGQRTLQRRLVGWNTGANVGKTRIRFLTGSVYLDTSSDGVSGAWKRIDNTADSCSASFLIAADSLGGARPVWEYRAWEISKAKNPTASTHVYRIQTREAYLSGSRRYFTPWTCKGCVSGYQDVTVQDSILIPNSRVAANVKTSLYSMGMVAGTLARLCPDDVGTTSISAGDSIIVDTLFFFTR